MASGPLRFPVVSSNTTLAVVPLNPVGCEVGLPWIRAVLAQPLHDQYDRDLVNLQARLML